MQMFDHSKIDFTVDKFILNEIPKDMGRGLKKISIDEDGKKVEEVIGLTSPGYEIVDYKKIVGTLENALISASENPKTKLNLKDTEFTTNVFDSGRKMELRAKFHGQKTHILDRKDCSEIEWRNSLVVPEFIFRSSHDRSWANNGMMGVWRNACWNTLVSGSKLAYVYGKHTKNFNIEVFGNKIRTAFDYISGTNIKKMRRWYTIPVTRKQAENLFRNTLAINTDNVDRENKGNTTMIKNLMKIFDEEVRHIHGRALYQKYATNADTDGTLHCVYQAATAWSSKPSKMTGKNDYDGHYINLSNPSQEDCGIVKNREARVINMLRSKHWDELDPLSNVPEKVAA